MTTPTGYITLGDVATELGISQSGITLDNASVRQLAGKPSGYITLDDLRGKSWNINLLAFHGPGLCYSGQAGFSLDRTNGSFILTMGAWPTDPPNCQTCDSEWLKNGAVINSQRAASDTRPYWTQVWTLNVSNIPVGNTVETRSPYSPYTAVSYTYRVTRNTETSITIERHPKFGTGDTGQSISISGWGDSFNATAGARSGGGWTVTTVAYSEPVSPPGDTGTGGDGGGGDGGTGDGGAGDGGAGDGGAGDGGGGGGDGGGGDGE